MSPIQYCKELIDKNCPAQAHVAVLLGTFFVLATATFGLVVAAFMGKTVNTALATVVGSLTALSGAAVLKGGSDG